MDGEGGVVAFEVEVGAPELVAVFYYRFCAPEIHFDEGVHGLGMGGEVAESVGAHGGDDVPERVAGGDDAHGGGGVPDVVCEDGDRLVGEVFAVFVADEFVGDVVEVGAMGAVVAVEGGDDDVFVGDF